MGRTQKLIRNYLGFHPHIEEVAVKPKNFRRSTKVVCPMGSSAAIDSRVFRHTIWRVDIPDKGSYALDIASAQYGYYTPLYPWAEYMKQRVESVVTVHPFGLFKNLYEEQVSKVKPLQSSASERVEAGLYTTVLYFSMKFMNRLNTEVQEWLKKQVWTNFDKMLRMAPREFEEKQTGLIKDIDFYLQDFKEWLNDYETLGPRFKKNMVPKSEKDKTRG